MPWPPEIGDLLPRADLAWCEPAKLVDWVLGVPGHGREWERIFRVGIEDTAMVWRALAKATVGATVYFVRDRGPFGVICGVMVRVTIGTRTARSILSWHYSDPEASPRLVTAYPAL